MKTLLADLYKVTSGHSSQCRDPIALTSHTGNSRFHLTRSVKLDDFSRSLVNLFLRFHQIHTGVCPMGAITATRTMKTITTTCIILLFACLSGASTVYEKTKRDEQHFTLEAAKPALMLAYAPYCKQSTIQDWSCYWCSHQDAPDHFQVTHFFDGKDKATLFGFAGFTQTQIVFSFRGTRLGVLKDILADLDIFPATPFRDAIPGAHVHRGFLDMYMSVRDDVIRSGIELSNKFPNHTLIVTGHSLGGAISTLVAADLAIEAQVKNPVQLWTFGSPRVGNEVFARYLDDHYLDKSFRVTHNRDPVPRLPPRLLGLEHVDTEYWFTNGESWTKCEREDASCSSGNWIVNFFDHGGYLGYNYFGALAYGCVF
ncbi:hypothetical protein PROFUN_00800 [Planoprotostelium fungivorum]|uniref:Fungal lipase-type domain-containing protein n=1 Tax=Planoprotostelium fungivorum TaxID=1890364 RepID=A0A2P6NZZ8_9EUKA|nr:hypothetical protein PROFUN_00800 [Planoprotostelium fungivorum]